MKSQLQHLVSLAKMFGDLSTSNEVALGLETRKEHREIVFVLLSADVVIDGKTHKVQTCTPYPTTQRDSDYEALFEELADFRSEMCRMALCSRSISLISDPLEKTE